MLRNKQLIPRKEPKQKRSKAMYDAILDATTHLLSENGYAATTTNHIAERTGISIGSLYQYFPNKDAIAVELLQRHIVSGMDYMNPLITHAMKSRNDPAKMVKAFIEAACDHHTDNPSLHKVLEEEVPHPAHIREALRHNEYLFAEAIAHWIELQRPQEVSNLTVAARLVFFLVKTMTHWYILSQQTEIEREVFVDELTTIVMRYLFPSFAKRSSLRAAD
jgi:AcrR family transcriptional regulator